MMSKLLVVFGATGQQGGSIIHTVLNDANLSKQYRLRAITRDSSKPAAQALASEGVELAQVDDTDKTSLSNALAGVHTAFILTTSSQKDFEIAQGKLIADTAVTAGATYLIFSTAAPAQKLAGKPVDMFDAKAEIEAHIRSLNVKSAFFAPGHFMETYRTHSAPRPTGEEGKFQIAGIPRNDTRVPMLDTAADTGKFVAPILAEPEKWEGQIMYGASGFYTFDEIARAISKATGKDVSYKSLPSDVFRKFLPPHMAEPMVQMMEWFRDVGYYGPETRELVEGTLAQVGKGELTTFEEFLERNPIELK